MQKYAQLAQYLQQAGWQIAAAPLADWSDIARVHSASYIEAWQNLSLGKQEARKLGFPPTVSLLNRSLASVGGTLAAMRDALDQGYGVNLAGGTHHAFADRGEGFCVFNDIAIASRQALAAGWVKQILIVDLDVHQGNGTAKIFEDEPQVITFSMHGARNYPFHKQRSDYDVELADGTGDDEYLDVLGQTLPSLLELRPQLVFFIAGVDVLAGDRYGRLALSVEGLVKRDTFVYQSCQQHGIPLVYVMGGGYQRDTENIVRAHAASLNALAELP